MEEAAPRRKQWVPAAAGTLMGRALALLPLPLPLPLSPPRLVD